LRGFVHAAGRKVVGVRVPLPGLQERGYELRAWIHVNGKFDPLGLIDGPYSIEPVSREDDATLLVEGNAQQIAKDAGAIDADARLRVYTWHSIKVNKSKYIVEGEKVKK
jgi:hypothetical protein